MIKMDAIQNISPASFGRVGVFLGGKPRERVISLKSGMAVYQALKNAGLDVILIDTANGFHSKIKHGFIDLAFLALHGRGGEDGTVQRFLARRRIPYAGSNAKASALAFDKIRAKKLFLKHGIPTPDFDVLTQKNWKTKIRKWDPPYVIKPSSEGSSIGVFFVEHGQIKAKQIQASLKYYPRLLVEKMIKGREFTAGILGEKPLPVIELKPKRKFYDYKAKYTKGLTDYLIPAPVSSELAYQLQTIALKVHKILGLRDLSRIDFKVDSFNQPYVLEANSIPGFTETSLLPKAAREIGIDFTKLCLKLLKMAQKRQRRGEENAKATLAEMEPQMVS